MKTRKGIIVVVGALALAGGGSIALAATGGGETPRARSVKELAGAGEVALLPSHNAGVGGWCLAQLVGSGGGEASARGDCQPRGSKLSTEKGPFQGPIVAEAGIGLSALNESGPWVSTVVALVKATAAAVSFKGYKQIVTHASALLPDHLRGAIIELQRSRMSKPRPRLPHGPLIAWSKTGKPIPQTFTPGSPLAFAAPVRSWSNGAPARRGVCDISVSGVAGLQLQSGGVVSEIKPHADVRGREFLNCAHSYYQLNEKWPIEAYVLLDAADPGAPPATMPSMRPLSGHRGVFIGPGRSEELARRIPGAWLLVSEGEDTAQRLTLLERLHV